MGAKVGKEGQRQQQIQDPSEDGSLSQKIGQMVEESRQNAIEQVENAESAKEPVRRADGTILQERGDKPRNAKKKMFEADVEEQKYEASRKRDEL